VVIANHPFGGPEALAVAMLVMRARADVKVLGNNEAMRLPGFADWTYPLEIFGGEGAARQNLAVLRETFAHLRRGGAIVVFPAGAVSHWQRESARVEDPPWPLHTARIVAKSGARVLPVRVFGHNGPVFQILGMLHPLLRSALILREFLVMRHRTVRCRAGALLAQDDLPGEPAAMTRALRAAVYRVLEAEGN
jgi:putative hemolysin